MAQRPQRPSPEVCLAKGRDLCRLLCFHQPMPVILALALDAYRIWADPPYISPFDLRTDFIAVSIPI